MLSSSDRRISADKENGVNKTDVDVLYTSPTPGGRAIVLIVLRPGRFPLDETRERIAEFMQALAALQMLDE